MSKRVPRPGEKPDFLLLYIGVDRHLLRIAMKPEGLVLGRNASDTIVDVDLTSFNASDHGVSREHVLIMPKRDHVAVKDLDAANGTWLNKKRMRPNTTTDAYHGDTLHLAELKIEILFAYEDDFIDNIANRGNTKRLDAGEMSAPMNRRDNDSASASRPAFDTQIPDEMINPFEDDEDVSPNRNDDWNDSPGVTKRFDD